MNVGYSASLINSTNLEIHIKPFIGEHDNSVFPRNLNLTSWKVLKFEGDSLELQLAFEKPLEISLNFMYDTLVLQIVNQT